MEVYTIKELWVLACEFDGIEPGAKFVVWSDKNPYARKYNFAVRASQVCAQIGNRFEQSNREIMVKNNE